MKCRSVDTEDNTVLCLFVFSPLWQVERSTSFEQLSCGSLILIVQNTELKLLHCVSKLEHITTLIYFTSLNSLMICGNIGENAFRVEILFSVICVKWCRDEIWIIHPPCFPLCFVFEDIKTLALVQPRGLLQHFPPDCYLTTPPGKRLML